MSDHDNPLDVQIGGGHYKDFAIQPVEFIHANNVPFIEGNCIKYLMRWREKGGVKDLEKVKHYIDLLIELEGLDRPVPPVGTPVEWPEDESRIDIIGQNGPDGAAYQAQAECDHDYEVAFDIKTLDGRVDGSLLRCAKCAATQIGGRNE